jgi:hypothetical protein
MTDYKNLQGVRDRYEPEPDRMEDLLLFLVFLIICSFFVCLAGRSGLDSEEAVLRSEQPTVMAEVGR